jgi:hypothetical protein
MRLKITLSAALACLLFYGAMAAGCAAPGTGNLHVLVISEDNAPLSGSKVVSETQPEGQMKVTGATDSEGSVTFDGIAAGEYEFYVSRFDYENQVFQVTVKGGRTAEVTITLEKTTLRRILEWEGQKALPLSPPGCLFSFCSSWASGRLSAAP